MNINFPVLISRKIPGAAVLAQTLEEGTIVNLLAEPENSYDKYAVAVYVGTDKIGYVPNRGILCPQCWGVVKKTDIFCPTCNVENGDMIEGGLARRVRELGLLENKLSYGCFIYAVNPNEEVMFKCTLLTVEREINE